MFMKSSTIHFCEKMKIEKNRKIDLSNTYAPPYPKYLLVIKDQINNDYKEFVRLKNYPTSKRSVGGKRGN